MSPSVLDRIIEATSARRCGRDRWLGHGVCHGSKRNPDFSIRESEDRILIHCFAGCAFRAICHALRIEPAHLFFGATLPAGQRPTPERKKVECRRIALQFDIQGVLLMDRAEAVLRTGSNQNTVAWGDDDFDGAMNAIEKAHDDLRLAGVLFYVADSQRIKAYQEGR
jgi:hypothetical protein